MFGLGWRSRVKRELSGANLTRAVKYFGVEGLKSDYSEMAVSFLQAETTKSFRSFRALHSKQGVEDGANSLVDLCVKNGFEVSNMYTALAVNFYPEVKQYLRAEVVTAESLMSRSDFAKYFFKTIMPNGGYNTSIMMFALFPPDNGSDPELRPLGEESRQALLSLWVDSSESLDAMRAIVGEFVRNNPHFNLYPAILLKKESPL